MRRVGDKDYVHDAYETISSSSLARIGRSSSFELFLRVVLLLL